MKAVAAANVKIKNENRQNHLKGTHLHRFFHIYIHFTVPQQFL